MNIQKKERKKATKWSGHKFRSFASKRAANLVWSMQCSAAIIQRQQHHQHQHQLDQFDKQTARRQQQQQREQADGKWSELMAMATAENKVFGQHWQDSGRQDTGTTRSWCCCWWWTTKTNDQKWRKRRNKTAAPSASRKAAAAAAASSDQRFCSAVSESDRGSWTKW